MAKTQKEIKAKETNPKENKSIWELAKESNNPKKEKRVIAESITQTSTFTNLWLENITKLYNEKKSLGLLLPSKKDKGTKKTLFRYITISVGENLKLNPNEINELLELGKYQKLF